MNEKLEKKLLEKFPKIFKNINGDPKNTCMYWGIECPDGWYKLIKELCTSLQWDTDKNKYPQVVADQVKEKFGTLRFYYHTENEGDETQLGYIQGTVSAYEKMSGDICSDCGVNKNIICTKGWIVYICKDCVSIRNEVIV